MPTIIKPLDDIARNDAGTMLFDLTDWLYAWIQPADALTTTNLAAANSVLTISNVRLTGDLTGILADYTVSNSAALGRTIVTFHWETTQGRKQTRGLPVNIVAAIPAC